MHAVTRGSKWKNHKAVNVTNASRFKSLKAGKTRKIKARQTGSNVKVHVGLRYESLDPKVAKVNSRGKVRAVSKGRTKILVFSQNGKDAVPYIVEGIHGFLSPFPIKWEFVIITNLFYHNYSDM